MDWNKKGLIQMARFNALSEAVMSRLQEKIEQRLSNETFESLGGSNLELKESVDVWTLPADSVSEPTNSLDLLAIDSGEYHLQINIPASPAIGAPSTPIAYARTSALSALGAEPTDWSVDGIFRSDLPQQIDQAIDWIDENIPDDNFLVRLLVAPAYHLHAFWLIDESSQENQKIIVIDAPSEYNLESFPKQYEVQEFLDKLRSVGYVQGIAEDEEI